MLIEPLGYTPKKKNVFMAVLIGYLANLALPRLGEVTRCGILTKYEKIPFNQSFGTVITERIIDMIAFILLFLLMIVTVSSKLTVYIHEKVYMPLQQKLGTSMLPLNNLIMILIAVISIVLILFYIKRGVRNTAAYIKVNKLVAGFLSGIKSLTRIKSPLKFTAYTIIIWILYLLMAYVVFYSLPDTSSLSLEAGLTVLVFGSIGIMIVQGGIGIYPAIVAETLFLYGISATTGYAMGWLIWSSQTIMVIIAGLISLLLLNTLNNKSDGNLRSDREQNIELSESGTNN